MSGLRGFLGRLFGRMASASVPSTPAGAGVFGELTNLYDYELPEKLDAAFTGSGDSAIAAVRRMAGLLAEVRTDDLPRVEVRIRSAWRLASRRPDSVDTLLENARSSGADVLGVVSFHANGFVREAAVNGLATLRDGSELRYLFLRLNDWVPPVRIAAHRAVLDRLGVDSASAVAASLPLIGRLARLPYEDRASLIARLAQVLATGGGAALAATLASSWGETSRLVVRFAIDHVPDALPEMVRRGVSAPDLVIRKWVTPLVVPALPADAALPVLQRLAADSSSLVRREAFLALQRAFPHDAEPFLRGGLLDASAAVREISRFLLREQHLDFSILYQAALRDGSNAHQLATALTGLAETGTASDADHAAPYLFHPSPRVRRAAVKSVMTLAGEAFADRVVAMLQDRSRAVSAAARNALRSHAPAVGRDRLMELFAGATVPHTREHLIPLLAALSKWQSITALVHVAAAGGEAATAAEGKVASLAHACIRDWNRNYNRSQATPTRTEIEQLVAALTAAGESLDESIATEIRFAIQGLSITDRKA
ncbi:MAG TPA: hypothetical protein VEK57_09595 [Thermoanaerobaculia bacterium]|nr:hypothetical protein [Thermoanaerobaculia bacterium]